MPYTLSSREQLAKTIRELEIEDLMESESDSDREEDILLLHDLYTKRYLVTQSSNKLLKTYSPEDLMQLSPSNFKQLTRTTHIAFGKLCDLLRGDSIFYNNLRHKQIALEIQDNLGGVRTVNFLLKIGIISSGHALNSRNISGWAGRSAGQAGWVGRQVGWQGRLAGQAGRSAGQGRQAGRSAGRQGRLVGQAGRQGRQAGRSAGRQDRLPSLPAEAHRSSCIEDGLEAGRLAGRGRQAGKGRLAGRQEDR
ncbi:hypothetical protein BY996DRAFT_6501477 [Phakopsora pachyrhizi]|nr:hypothetical protein BY996DRAFT_6501477 [Phakopsora pachyrhizi]